jgi:hypothetical protein
MYIFWEFRCFLSADILLRSGEVLITIPLHLAKKKTLPCNSERLHRGGITIIFGMQEMLLLSSVMYALRNNSGVFGLLLPPDFQIIPFYIALNRRGGPPSTSNKI